MLLHTQIDVSSSWTVTILELILFLDHRFNVMFEDNFPELFGIEMVEALWGVPRSYHLAGVINGGGCFMRLTDRVDAQIMALLERVLFL